MDIAIINRLTKNIGIFLGYGNGTFPQQQTYLIQRQILSLFFVDMEMTLLTIYSTGISSVPSSIAVKDLNKDNYFDIVVSNYGSNDVLVFWGSNNGTFLGSKSYSVGYNAHPQSLAIGDINNDSLMDIIVGNYVEILLQTCQFLSLDFNFICKQLFYFLT